MAFMRSGICVVPHLFSSQELRLVLVVNSNILSIFLLFCLINHFDQCWEDIGNICLKISFLITCWCIQFPLLCCYWPYKCNANLKIMLYFSDVLLLISLRTHIERFSSPHKKT